MKGYENALPRGKHIVRITLDIEVEIRDVAKGLLEGENIETHSYSPEHHSGEHLELQSRILDALLKNPEHLERQIIEWAGLTASEELGKRWTSRDGETTSSSELIRALYDELLPQDIKLLKSQEDNDVLIENTQIALYDAFKTKLLAISEYIIE